jgi:hypothetical protein
MTELSPMTEYVPVPRHLVGRLWVSVWGALVFLTVSTVHGVFVPGFDPWHQSVSALALAPAGWVQAINFVLLGVAVLATVPAWRGVLAGAKGASWYPRLTAVLGVSFMAAGCVPQDPAPGYDPAGLAIDELTLTGLVHLAIAGVAAACSVALLFVVASRLAGQASWIGWPRYTRAIATLTIICIAVYGVWSTRATGYAGTFERAAIMLPTIWGASFLRRLGQGTPFMRAAPVATVAR